MENTTVESAPAGRRVLCAAIWISGLEHVISAHRYFDNTMSLVLAPSGPKSRAKWEHGFIDQHGVWMDREEARRVALAAGQVKIDSDDLISNDLFSE